MKSLLYLSIPVYLLLFQGLSCKAVTITVGGTYNTATVWCADTIKVTADVLVEDSLTICAGSYVEFQGNFGIDAKGLFAIGTSNDSIVFTVKDTTGFHNFDSDAGGWGGLNSRGDMQLEYCVLEFGKCRESVDVWFWERKSLLSFAWYNDDDSESVIGIRNCLFQNNFSTYDAEKNQPLALIALYHNAPKEVEITGCSFRNNYSTVLLNDAVGTLIENNVFVANKGGSVIRLDGDTGNATVKNNQFKNNQAGAIKIRGDSWPGADINDNLILNNKFGISVGSPEFLLIRNNIIANNNSFGGIYVYNAANCTISNNLIYGNHNSDSTSGGGISLEASTSQHILNNTIVNNSAVNGGGIYFDNSSAIIHNSIIRNNMAGSLGNQIYNYDEKFDGPGRLFSSFHNSNIQGGLDEMVFDEFLGEYIDNIDADPEFANPLVNDYRLTYASPCFNTGDNIAGLPPTDLDGKPRIIAGIVDMGAYEYLPVFPELEQSPMSQNLCLGDSLKLTCAANGDIDGRQWQKNGIDIPGETGTDFVLSNCSLEDAAAYNCVLYNSTDTASSDTAYITINTLPEVDLGGPYAFCQNETLVLKAPEFKSHTWSSGETESEMEVSEAGYYSLTVTDDFGCSNSDSVVVTMLPLPIISLGSDTTITSNDTLVLDAGAGFNHYLWHDGSEEPSYEIAQFEPGVYPIFVVVTDENACTAKDIIEVSVKTTVGLQSGEESISALVYPNPANNSIHINLEAIQSGNIAELNIDIVDFSGKLVYSRIIDRRDAESEISIDISALKTGVYYVFLNREKLRSPITIIR